MKEREAKNAGSLYEVRREKQSPSSFCSLFRAEEEEDER